MVKPGKRRGAERLQVDASNRLGLTRRVTDELRTRSLLFSIGNVGFGGLIAILAVLFVLLQPIVKTFFAAPISEVQFSGFSGGAFNEEYGSGVSEEELLAIAVPFMGSSYWEVNLEELRLAIEEHPWVRQAIVRKSWPETLWVGVDEYVPVARWNDNKLLTMDGSLFEVESQAVFNNLPRFSLRWLEQPSRAMVSDLVREFNQLQLVLRELSLKIEEIEMLTTNNLRVSSHDGPVIFLGTQDHQLRLDRLRVFAESIGINQLRRFESIDLRYSNGIAVSEEPLAYFPDSSAVLSCPAKFRGMAFLISEVFNV